MRKLLCFLGCSPRRKLRGLRLELYHLLRQIKRTRDTIDRAQAKFASEGGCPCCFWAACGGVHSRMWKLSEKNERREERVQQIKQRLVKDGWNDES